MKALVSSLAVLLLAGIADADDVDAQIADIMSDQVRVTDPKNRETAKQLITEGNKQLVDGHAEQALANFLEAYAKFPSPKILLSIGTALSEMSRFADAANAYQRFLSDPATPPAGGRRGEVEAQLAKLDPTLTRLTIRVFPRGSDISVDGGPFVTVGQTLDTRVRPGLHLVRIKYGDKNDEYTVNGFEGEAQELAAALKMEVPPDPPAVAIEEHHQAFLDTDYHFVRDESAVKTGGTISISYRQTAEAPPVPPLLQSAHSDDEPPDPTNIAPDDTAISSGAIGVVRIDGKGRGFAGGLGIAIARQRFEGEIMVLRSQVTGGYLGARARILTGWVRPYVGGGVPVFVFDNEVTSMGTGAMPITTTETRVAIGLRLAAGLELELNGHLSVQFDLGGEHFFNVSNTRFEANAFVPTVGVIGRL